MTSVVSTVAVDWRHLYFLELRKGRTVSEAAESYGPRSLYQVVPEKQTNVRGLMGSERGYDVSAVAGAPIPVLGDERGTKVRFRIIFSQISWLNNPHVHVEKSKRRGCYIGRRRVGRSFRGRVTPQVRCPCSWKRRCFLERGVEERTSRIWWRRKWQRKNKRWTEIARRTRKEARSSSSDMFSVLA